MFVHYHGYFYYYLSYNQKIMSGLGTMRILLLILLLITNIVEARMYQWTEPGVETTQLSGKPPVWYRSAAGGPRVFVFDNGRLIDDTAVEVSDEVRQRMRQQAFVLVEEDRQKAEEKLVKAQELKQKYKKTEIDESRLSSSDEVDEKDSIVEFVTETLSSEGSLDDQADKDSVTDKSIDELRAVIADWEKSQTESAKQALE
jgi:hypothetical protein